MKQITAKQLQDYLAECQSDPLLLDVREPWEFEYCHIEGSVHIPMGELAHEIHTLDPQRETVIICHHGIRSQQMGYYMQQTGFKHVINLDGGIEKWAEDVELTMKKY